MIIQWTQITQERNENLKEVRVVETRRGKIFIVVFFYSTLSQQIRYITKCKKRERVEKGMIQCRKILASKARLWFCCWFRKWRKFCQAVTG